MRATRPWTSASSRASSAKILPRRSASSQSCGRIQSSPAVARIALVEDQVDDREHRRQPGCKLIAVRNLEQHIFLAQGPFGADDPLGDGRLRDQEGTSDFLGRQSAKQAQRERDARIGGKHRVAGGEHKAQEIVANLIVERGIEIGLCRVLLDLELIAELPMFSFEQLVPAEKIDGAMFCGRHEPSAGIFRDARFGPLFEAARGPPGRGPRRCRRRAPCG